VPVDSEVESDDCDEEQLEELAIESTVAEQLDQLREELRELERASWLSRQLTSGTETKLKALKECLSTEFDELKDGRGKLLILLNIGTPGISQAESHCMGI